jgi:hypothetical protein
MAQHSQNHSGYHLNACARVQTSEMYLTYGEACGSHYCTVDDIRPVVNAIVKAPEPIIHHTPGRHLFGLSEKKCHTQSRML